MVDVLRELERSHPKLGGWILDDQRKVRQHVAVFLEGERVDGDARVTTEDRLEVIGAVSGGAATELPGRDPEGSGSCCAGEREERDGRRGPGVPGSSVEFAIRPRTGRYFASVTHGSVLARGSTLRTIRPARGTRRRVLSSPRTADTTLVRTWAIAPGRRRRPVRRGRPGRAVREPGRRDDVGAQPRALGPAQRGPIGARGAGGLLPALDRARGRASPIALAVGISSVACGCTGGRRGVLGASATRGSIQLPTGGVARHQAARRAASTTCTGRRPGPNASSCSSTAASTVPTTPARSWTEHRARPADATSASRWSSIRTTPTPPT